MSRFNLVDEQWIPVRFPDGSRDEMGIQDVLLRAKEIAAIEDPAYAFNYIFGNVSTGGGPSPALIQEKSILDGVIAEFAAVNPKLSAADRAKLDNHLTQVRDIETRIGNIGNGGACTVPAAPSAIDLTKNDNYPAIGDAQTRLLVQALKCDLTRFATLQWSRGGSATVHNWLSPGGVRINDNHHNLSHNAQTSTQAHDWMVAIDTWYAQKVADLLAQMKAVPEGTGNMLDHSVVLWCSELSNGDTHQRLNMPLVLFGKCGGAIRPGRTVAYTAAPNNKLLTSLANAMGLPITSYGDARYPGALTGLS